MIDKILALVLGGFFVSVGVFLIYAVLHYKKRHNRDGATRMNLFLASGFIVTGILAILFRGPWGN